MSWELFTDVLRNSILITGLVIIMMLMIEYFNIRSRGRWFIKLRGSRFKQVLLGSFLGLVPGCIGGFAGVSLFTHNLISFGALVAMMISSSGDEAFIIMAMIPQKALILFGILFGIGVITGVLIDYVFFKNPQKKVCPDNFEIHQAEESKIPSIFKTESYRVMRRPSKERIIILAGIALFICAVIFGILECGHDHCGETCTHNHSSGLNILNERWINIIFAVISIITLFFTATAKEHFIKEHLWKHVIKRHLVSIFLWTFCTLLVCQIGLQYLDVEHWISSNMLFVILLAVAIGIIPESGPHMVFITLYVQGILPFYVLLVNSIVQDGHTTLPLLAESKSAFIKSKAINIAVGLLVGLACWTFRTI